MKLFDDLITNIYNLLPSNSKSFNYEYNKKHEGRKSELILTKELAYELGGINNYCTCFNIFTEDDKLVNKDEILLYGSDILDINKDSNFARISIIKTKEATIYGEQALYNILENINLKNLDINISGFMLRTSVLSSREQVRVGKNALKNKLSFKDVGSYYINEYKKNKYVESVKIIFITLDDFNYKELDNISIKNKEILRALNHVLSDLKMDCKHCEWKLLCEEVEGMKKFHENLLKERK